MDPSTREVLGRLIAAEHRLHEHMRQQEQLVERWRARAELATRRGEDQLAREALTRKAEHERRAEELRSQYLEHAGAVHSAKRRLAIPAAATRPDPEATLDQLAREDRLERDLRELKERLTARR